MWIEDNKIRLQKSEIAQWKNTKRKIDEKNLQLYGLVEKGTEKLMNQISILEELECEKYLNMNQ